MSSSNERTTKKKKKGRKPNVSSKENVPMNGKKTSKGGVVGEDDYADGNKMTAAGVIRKPPSPSSYKQRSLSPLEVG